MQAYINCCNVATYLVIETYNRPCFFGTRMTFIKREDFGCTGAIGLFGSVTDLNPARAIHEQLLPWKRYKSSLPYLISSKGIRRS